MPNKAHGYIYSIANPNLSMLLNVSHIPMLPNSVSIWSYYNIITIVVRSSMCISSLANATNFSSITSPTSFFIFIFPFELSFAGDQLSSWQVFSQQGNKGWNALFNKVSPETAFYKCLVNLLLVNCNLNLRIENRRSQSWVNM